MAQDLPPRPTKSPFDDLYGLEVVEISDDVARGRVPVDEKITQPIGLVHGGVYASIAEALASTATAAAVHERGEIAMGMANHTSFLRPVTSGTIHAVARPLHRGRTSWLWDIQITDDDDKLVAISRMTIAVRPRPAAS